MAKYGQPMPPVDPKQTGTEVPGSPGMKNYEVPLPAVAIILNIIVTASGLYLGARTKGWLLGMVALWVVTIALCIWKKPADNDHWKPVDLFKADDNWGGPSDG